MEPLSTLVLVAAFFAPIPLTKRPDWDVEVLKKSEVMQFLPTTNELVFAPVVKTEDIVMPTSIGIVLDRRDLLVSKVNSFKKLEAGWDGSGSVPPADRSYEAALKFIDLLPGGIPVPSPMLSSDGHVGFYWDLEGGFADLNFEYNGAASFFSRTKYGVEFFAEELWIEDFSRQWFFDMLGEMAAPTQVAA